MNECQENRIEFVGTIAEKIQQQSAYEIIQQERALLCKVVLHIQRRSGEIDKINVFIDKEELKRNRIGKGLKVKIEGVIRTCNEYDLQNKRHVITYVRAWKISKVHSETADKNRVIVSGTLSQTPKFCKSSSGRRRINFNLCTKDLGDKITSFIPCIARNAMADVLCELTQWEELSFEGRLQSREYIKTWENGVREKGTAFEVVVTKLI